MHNYQFDILIIGTGISGLATAIELAQSGCSVGLVTREKDPNISNTFWAQGGVIYPESNPEALIEDIIKASSYSSSLEATKTLAEEGAKAFEELLLAKAQVPFEKMNDGSIGLTQEAAHSRARIAYRGDFTGKAIQIALLNAIKKLPNVKILTGHTAIDLITPLHHGKNLSQRYEDEKVVGAYVYHQEKERVVNVMARATVLATGGIGALYLHHSNSEGARGDGHAMAKRAGARIINMEFIQFHPTTFYDRSSHRRFLISEAVRGEGGILLNSKGKRFMEGIHPDAELAPRDVVAMGISEEMIASQEDCVYLDITKKDPEWLKQRFPTIYEHCLERRVDITKEPIPVVPAAHYTCGGVKTDLSGRTNIPGLYAVGEVACNGLHGANRLASTSLLEGVVFGKRTGQQLLKDIENVEFYELEKIHSWDLADGDFEPALVQQDWTSLRQTMWNYVGLIRSSNRLKRAEAMLSELNVEVQKFYRHCRPTDELIGLRNGIEVAQLVLHASMRNKESLGCFYRKS